MERSWRIHRGAMNEASRSPTGFLQSTDRGRRLPAIPGRPAPSVSALSVSRRRWITMPCWTWCLHLLPAAGAVPESEILRRSTYLFCACSIHVCPSKPIEGVLVKAMTLQVQDAPEREGSCSVQFGGPGGTRTRDTRFRRPVLCPLSYGPITPRILSTLAT